MAHLESTRTGNPPAAPSRRAVLVSNRKRAWLYRLAAPVLVLVGLLVWEWGVANGIISALFFPAPTKIASALIKLAQNGLLQDVGFTLSSMFLGLLIGGSVGVILGLLMGWSESVRMVAEPFVAGLHPMPKSALLPLLLILMGIGDPPRITLVALASFFPLLINTMSSVRSIEPVYLEAAINYGARGIRLFVRIILPASLPGILSGVRIAVNTALTISITTEILMGNHGLGARIWMAWETLRTENLYAILIVIAAVGLAGNWLLRHLTLWLMPWSPGTPAIEK